MIPASTCILFSDLVVRHPPLALVDLQGPFGVPCDSRVSQQKPLPWSGQPPWTRQTDRKLTRWATPKPGMSCLGSKGGSTWGCAEAITPHGVPRNWQVIALRVSVSVKCFLSDRVLQWVMMVIIMNWGQCQEAIAKRIEWQGPRCWEHILLSWWECCWQRAVVSLGCWQDTRKSRIQKRLDQLKKEAKLIELELNSDHLTLHV